MPHHLLLLDVATTLNTVFDVALVTGILRKDAGARRVGPARVSAAAATLAATWVLRIPLLLFVGIGPFGIVRLVYAGVVLGLPAVGLFTLWSAWRWRRTSRAVIALALTALLGLPFGAYASFVEPFRLQLETADVPLPRVREGESAVRVGVLADLQTDRIGDHERGAVARLMAERPDVIVIPGDLFQDGRETLAENWDALRDLLRSLHAPGGVFAVPGDCETADGLRRMCDGTGVRVLDDEAVRLTLGDRRVRIIGVARMHSLDEAHDEVRRLSATCAPGEVRVVVTHRPDVALGLADSLAPGPAIDLLIAGHTHGGQVTIPYFGPPITLSRVPRAVAAGGLHILDGTPVYVSRGVGCERAQAPRVRFLCPPEVTVLTLGGGGAPEIARAAGARR